MCEGMVSTGVRMDWICGLVGVLYPPSVRR